MSDEDLKAEFDQIELAHNQANAQSKLTRRKLRKTLRKQKDEAPDHMLDGSLEAGDLCGICGPIIEEIE